MYRPRRSFVHAVFAAAGLAALGMPMFTEARVVLPGDRRIDLKDAVVVVRAGNAVPVAERTAAAVLIEELEKRTGIRLRQATELPRRGTAIAITSGERDLRPEGYRVGIDTARAGLTVVRIAGADGRGALFGVGHVLRKAEWGPGRILLPPIDVATSPAYAIRGHQLGYRARANSWDAWTPAQFEQYIRELAIWGANAIENIPFEDAMPSPHMPIPRDEMNIRFSEICAKYDVDYWVWTPAVFDLTDTEKRAAEIEKHEAFYRAAPRLDAVFFPGGDPGENHPREVMPFLEELATHLHRHHPRAGMWISLQGFNREQVEYFFAYMKERRPAWLAGVVAGPGSPPIPLTRQNLDRAYRLRSYPDVTHNVRCQNPIAWWDPALNFTLGRESPNPRPIEYAEIHNRWAPWTDGFLTYSDGVHDDVNKTVWSARGWDPGADVREILLDYARFFWGSDVANEGADGILALEQNWHGPLALNGGVEGTYRLWEDLAARKPELSGNWRWQLCRFRANYDAYTRTRQMYEKDIEERANEILAEASRIGSRAAMGRALAMVKTVDTQIVRRDVRARIDELAEALFRSIGLQTSVPKYNASGWERGAVMDFVDYPLNNRWWLEDEFARIDSLATEADKLARLEVIRTWENPGPGSFYDNIGDVANSSHVLRDPPSVDPPRPAPIPGFAWWNEGKSRARLSFQSSMNPTLVYEHLDSTARYTLRITGSGGALVNIDGQRVEPSVYGTGLGEFKEYPVPASALDRGKITVTFDRPPRDANVNWRQQSRLTDVWLLKR